MDETDWIGHNFAAIGAAETSFPAAGIEAVGSAFRAVEYELGRELD